MVVRSSKCSKRLELDFRVGKFILIFNLLLLHLSSIFWIIIIPSLLKNFMKLHSTNHCIVSCRSKEDEEEGSHFLAWFSLLFPTVNDSSHYLRFSWSCCILSPWKECNWFPPKKLKNLSFVWHCCCYLFYLSCHTYDIQKTVSSFIQEIVAFSYSF